MKKWAVANPDTDPQIIEILRHAINIGTNPTLRKSRYPIKFLIASAGKLAIKEYKVEQVEADANRRHWAFIVQFLEELKFFN